MTPATDPPAIVNAQRLQLPVTVDPDTTYDVLVNGVHVWSLLPERDARTRRGVLVAPWPPALRKHLVGHADVVLRDHVTGEIHVETHHVFAGDHDRTVSVTDSDGQGLVLDKWGRLTRPLSAEGADVVDDLVQQAARLLSDLQERAGVAAFVSYGTLLGAVRDGALIGHDNDLDVSYVSREPFPVDVVREGYRVERALLDAGWRVRRGSGTRLNVRMTLSGGGFRYVDVFTANWVDGIVYMPSDTGFAIPMDEVVPLTTVTLHGREVPAPRNPDLMLAHTYGENWRIPDPSFKYDTPRWLKRRIMGWFGGLNSHRKHWDGFYNKSLDVVPTAATSFARWVQSEYPSSAPLVDLGCGSNRDGLFFGAEHGRRVLGIDFATRPIRLGRRAAMSEGMDARFRLVNLYDLRAVLTLGAQLSRTEEPVDLYGRFLMHALKPAGQDHVLRLASMALRRGGRLFLEFRTEQDEERHHLFPDHGSHYVDPDELVARIESFGGLVERREEGLGMATMDDEDPHVCRIVARWSGPAAALGDDTVSTREDAR